MNLAGRGDWFRVFVLLVPSPSRPARPRRRRTQQRPRDDILRPVLIVGDPRARAVHGVRHRQARRRPSWRRPRHVVVDAGHVRRLRERERRPGHCDEGQTRVPRRERQRRLVDVVLGRFALLPVAGRSRRRRREVRGVIPSLHRGPVPLVVARREEVGAQLPDEALARVVRSHSERQGLDVADHLEHQRARGVHLALEFRVGVGLVPESHPARPTGFSAAGHMLHPRQHREADARER